ncbi:MAG: hypothetical protein ACRDPY_30330, partial [Streptosporangiaceae bacterium]
MTCSPEPAPTRRRRWTAPPARRPLPGAGRAGHPGSPVGQRGSRRGTRGVGDRRGGGRPGALGQALATGAVIDLPTGNLARAGRRFRRARKLLEQAGETRGAARVLYWQAMSSYMAGR